MVKIGRDKRWMTPEIKQKLQLSQSLFFNGSVEEHTKLSKEVAHLISRAKFKYNRNFTTGKPDYWKEIEDFKDQCMSQEQAVELNTAFHAVWNGQNILIDQHTSIQIVQSQNKKSLLIITSRKYSKTSSLKQSALMILVQLY